MSLVIASSSKLLATRTCMATERAHTVTGLSGCAGAHTHTALDTRCPRLLVVALSSLCKLFCGTVTKGGQCGGPPLGLEKSIKGEARKDMER